MSDAEDAAISALREAVRAVSIGEDTAASTAPGEHRETDVAREAGRLLEAVARLLRSTDLDAVPRNGANHRLHAIVQHLDAGAELARRLGEPAGAPGERSDAVGQLGRHGSAAESDRETAGRGDRGDRGGRGDRRGADEPSMPENRRDAEPS